MNRTKTCSAALAATIALSALALADMGTTQLRPNAGFDRIKGLVGDWQGAGKDGKPVTINYTLVADGSALMETLNHGQDSPMVTMYYPDGARLMMTHYCSAHNQPRMRADAQGAEPKALTFNFVDATNLSSPSEGHMERLVVSFIDLDHFSQEWTFKAKGQKQVDLFSLERKN